MDFQVLYIVTGSFRTDHLFIVGRVWNELTEIED